MYRVIKLSLLIFLVVITGCAQKEMGVIKFPAGKVQHVVRAVVNGAATTEYVESQCT